MKQMRANKANPQPSHAERGEVAFPASGRPTLKPPGSSRAATVVFSTSQAAAVRFQPVPRIFDDSLDSWHDGERPCVPIPLFDSRCMSVSTAATLTATTNEAAIHASRLHGDFPCRWNPSVHDQRLPAVYPAAGVQTKMEPPTANSRLGAVRLRGTVSWGRVTTAFSVRRGGSSAESICRSQVNHMPAGRNHPGRQCVPCGDWNP
jgi:hypothetical protein